ncbi:hypothetical protein NDU88_005993 [Pleurodeles waltl]|uniref:Uncharacterized protein n=1 Tax=Pleurodeles waltl TaxID=8319 RepID=A0AAV7VLM8_PLEWA|nr:hypothetical protein NDU88_005993 [Pleurodeles waltl]
MPEDAAISSHAPADGAYGGDQPAQSQPTLRLAPTRRRTSGVPSPRKSAPGGLPQTEHPLPEKMGGHSTLEQEDGGGPAGDGLPTSHHDPPDVQDPGGGIS